jgi:hypothetical protein
MRIIGGCLILTLVCLSCRRVETEADVRGESASKEVQNLLKDYYRGYPFNFEIRGPVPLREFRETWIRGYQEWAERMRKTDRSAGTFEGSSQGRTCARLEAEYREGDELYFFRSEELSWNDLAGTEGYVLIRAGKVIVVIETKVN